MKITGIRLSMLRVPLHTPFRTALRTVDAIHDVIVQIHTDCGLIGHGGAPSTVPITGDSHESIIAAVENHISPLLLGQKAENLNFLTGLVQSSISHNSSAKAAVEIALYDLWAQMHNAPLYQLLGGGQAHLSTDITISIDHVDKMVSAALQAVELGYAALKIKVGESPKQDIERVIAIHDAVGGRALLRLDANQGWTGEQAVQTMQTLEAAGILLELLEQPVQAHDIEGMRYVTKHIDTPVMADESVFTPEQALELIRLRAADIINIKLMKTGGISNAIKLADIAGLHNVSCMIGCMIESSVSVNAAAHIAAAKSGVITKVDLDGPSLGQFNPVRGGALFSASQIHLTEAAGLGISGIEGLQPLSPT